MGKVARQVVEQAGVNVDQLVQSLVRAASAEFTTFYYYTILRVNAIGHEGEGLKEIIEDARIEDRNHFEALVPRIYELGGEIPRDVKEFSGMAACPDAYLPQNPRDITELLNVLVGAERCAIRVYTDICAMTSGKDPRTYDLSLAILHEEVEHEAWFSEFLGEGPSGHFRRAYPGESPYVSKFLTVPAASRRT
jgi:ferritin-like protein